MTTQTARRQSATSGNQDQKAPKPFRGQLGPEAIGDILKSNRTNASKARSAFLKSHPHYTACSVAGCQGLVGRAVPANDTRWAQVRVLPAATRACPSDA